MTERVVARSLLRPGAIVRRLPAYAYLPHRLEISGQAYGGVRILPPWSSLGRVQRRAESRHVWVLRHKDCGPPTNVSRRHLTDDEEQRFESLLRAAGLLA
jgi:hypothetical protein